MGKKLNFLHPVQKLLIILVYEKKGEMNMAYYVAKVKKIVESDFDEASLIKGRITVDINDLQRAFTDRTVRSRKMVDYHFVKLVEKGYIELKKENEGIKQCHVFPSLTDKAMIELEGFKVFRDAFGFKGVNY